MTRLSIRTVLLEDDDLDAQLVEAHLAAEHIHPVLRRTRNEREFEAELARGEVDLILADFSLPQYDGLSALGAAKRIVPEVPFIFVSGAIGEELALETLRRGATDYVLKSRLERLAPAVTRALDVVGERRKRREAEAERDRLLVSERQARESAEAANRMKDEFLATVSHELRTPLNAILGWSSLLVIAEPDRATLAKGLETIERNARVQSRLIEDILDISRIVTGKLQLRLASQSVATLTNAAVDAVRPAAAAKGIELTVDVGSAGDVVGDADRLQQVVWNLVANAVKFTPEGGRVEVTATRAPDAVFVVVTDSGSGIEPAFLPHVFDRFRQSDSSVTRRHGGLGLGLAIVRHLVELHGGSVSAASDGLDRGAAFTIRLPVARAAAFEAAHPRADGSSRVLPTSDGEPRRALDGVHALVVDDEPDTRDLVALVLRRSGAQVTTAGSVVEALALLPELKPTIIISDIGMPNIDGYSFARRLRALPPEAGGATPAIALTAYARELDRREAEAAGFQRHIAKPVTPAVLVAAVAEIASTS